jgi:glycosyltransferase involved in cell wall biosynthesis
MREVTARRILMTTDAVGGVWTHALDLAAALRPLGVTTALCALGPGVDAARRLQAGRLGLELVVLEQPLDWMASSPAELLSVGEAVAALAAFRGVDLVQLNSPALAIAEMPCPVLGVCHSCLATWWMAVRQGPMPSDFAWRTAKLARGYARCDALVAPTSAFAKATAAAHALAAPPAVVWNGRMAGSRADAMRDFAFSAGRLWDAGKDLATLDRAAARVGLPVLAAGPLLGPQGEVVSPAHARALGALGPAAIRRWLARGPIFVSTARYEPFGLSVLEAAQAGCALVLSDIPTFRELWSDAALFVAVGDDAGFAAAIARLADDREQRSTLSVAALRRSRRYGVAAMAAGMAAQQARLLGTAAERPGRSVAA